MEDDEARQKGDDVDHPNESEEHEHISSRLIPNPFLHHSRVDTIHNSTSNSKNITYGYLRVGLVRKRSSVLVLIPGYVDARD